jgi:hypothetical protein
MSGDRIAEIRERLSAAPCSWSIESHGDGEALYSQRGQPIILGRSASHTSRQHGYQLLYFDRCSIYDDIAWPSVRAVIASAPEDIAYLLARCDELQAEIAQLLLRSRERAREGSL